MKKNFFLDNFHLKLKFFFFQNLGSIKVDPLTEYKNSDNVTYDQIGMWSLDVNIKSK